MSIWLKDKQKFGELLLEELSQTCSLNTEGKLQYIGRFGLTSFDMLAECLKISEISELSNNDVQIEKIVKDVIECLLQDNGQISEPDFNRKFRQFVKRKKYTATVKYQIILEAFMKIPKNYNFYLDDCEIKVITKKFSKKLFLTNFDGFLSKTIFIVNCDGVSLEKALLKTMQSINLSRAILHISEEPKWKLLVEESLFKPFNPIMLSKHYYIFQENEGYVKSINRDNFSFDDNSISEIKLIHSVIKKSQEIIRKLEQIRVSNNNYYNFLAGSLIQLIKALESLDLTNSLPLMWSAIETIILKNNECNYDLFIERCSSFYTNKFKVKNMLILIKDHRNNFVHNGKENIKLTKLFLIELEKIYRDLFYFHLNNAFSGGGFEEVIDRLSFQGSQSNLKK